MQAVSVDPRSSAHVTNAGPYQQVPQASAEAERLACWSPLPEYGEPDNCHVAHL
jgi:hypothetical protein